MLGGSILLDKYSRHVADDIAAGGFEIEASLFNVIEGGNHVAMAKTACLTALEFTNSLYTASPDVVVICGDRFEQLAIAMAAAYLNITIAHIEGGDVTGSIDESVRHAITKLAHLHFVTNEDAQRRVLAMGEDPRYVFNTGSLDVELAAHVSTTITNEQVNALGVGHDVDIEQPFLMVVQHPVTTETDNRAHLETTLRVVASFELPTIWFWPNPDAGTGEMADSLRHMRESHPELTAHMRFITNVPANDFVGAAGARGLPGRQFVGRHQGVLVPGHAGGQHRRPPAGPPDRRARDARRLRRRRRSAPRSRRSSRTAATSRRTSTTGQRQRDDRRRAGDDAAVHAEAVSRS